MTTIMFKRGKVCLIADIFQTVIEPLDDKRQVVFFCQTKDGTRYRVPKSEVIAKCASQPASKPKKEKKKKRKCAREY